MFPHRTLPEFLLGCVVEFWPEATVAQLNSQIQSAYYAKHTCYHADRHMNTHKSLASAHFLAYISIVASESVLCQGSVCVCMCMDAHVPSHWGICGNSELAVMAKLAIKLCQGRDPSEGCNVYHWALAQALCHGNPEFLANAEIMPLWKLELGRK